MNDSFPEQFANTFTRPDTKTGYQLGLGFFLSASGGAALDGATTPAGRAAAAITFLVGAYNMWRSHNKFKQLKEDYTIHRATTSIQPEPNEEKMTPDLN